jgi:hypothetical protein
MRDCPVALFGEDKLILASSNWNLGHLTHSGDMAITALILESKCYLRVIQYHTQRWLSLVHEVYCVS